MKQIHLSVTAEHYAALEEIARRDVRWPNYDVPTMLLELSYKFREAANELEKERVS